jgi:hypothetical protein
MKPLLLLILVLYFNYSLGQETPSGIETPKGYSVRLFIGSNTWADAEYKNRDGFESRPIKSIGATIGLSYEKYLLQSVFYRATIEYAQVNEQNNITFNRNNYPMFFEKDTMNDFSGRGYTGLLSNHKISGSILIGLDWEFRHFHKIKTSSGIGFSQFLFPNLQQLFRIDQSDDNSQIIAIFNISNPISSAFFLPLNLDYINSKHKIHYGLGLSYVCGFNRYLHQSENAIILFPQTNQMERFTVSRLFQYSGIRFFVGF